MTSAQTMYVRGMMRQRTQRRLRLRALIFFVFIIIALSIVAAGAGCESKPTLQPPLMLTSPYPQPQLWAVAPFNNESGISSVDGARVADFFVEQLEQVNGISAVPVNRVISAMRRLEMRSIATSKDAVKLMSSLGIDGLIIGTITAWDPYNPPKFGAAVQLFQRDEVIGARNLDTVQLSRDRTEHVSPGALGSNGPIAQASALFDAASHQTLKWLDEYAVGRVEPDSAYGNRIYLVHMELYTQFAAFRLTHDLLAHEQRRLMTANAAPTQ